MLDKFTHLFRFQAIVEEGSMHRAAGRLNLTQPALSRSIAILEESFGRQLLERHARGVRPTPFGEKVLHNTLRLSRYWEIADRELRADPQQQRVALRLGIGPIWRSGLLAPVFEEMRKLHPEMLIEIAPLRELRAVADLNEGKLDAVLGGTRIDRREQPQLVSHDLLNINLHIMAREDHPIFDRLAQNGAHAERSILEYPWIIYSEMALYADDSDRSISDRFGREPDIWMKSANLMTVLTTLQRSDSLCVLSDLAVSSAKQPRLVPVPVNLRRKQIPVGLMHRDELSDWPLMRNFIALCQAHLKPETLYGDSGPALV
jgi:DNA-binding transcriptional LysR family regulator